MGPMEALAASRRALKALVDGSGGLEREIATGEHKYNETEINSRRKGDLWSWQSTMKLLGMTSTTNELRSRRIRGRRCELGCEQKGREGGLDSGSYR